MPWRNRDPTKPGELPEPGTREPRPRQEEPCLHPRHPRPLPRSRESLSSQSQLLRQDLVPKQHFFQPQSLRTELQLERWGQREGSRAGVFALRLGSFSFKIDFY